MASDDRNPACPRCGYDLSGETSTWADRCPVLGRCTECGLDFAWRNLLNPKFATPRGSIEHSRLGFLGTRVLRAGAVTWLRVALPWLLWTRLRLEHRIVWRRLLLVVVFLALPGHVLMMLVGSVLGATAADLAYAWAGWQGWLVPFIPATGTTWLDVLLHAGYGLAVPYHTAAYVVWIDGPELVLLSSGALSNVLMGVFFLTLFETLRRTRVRRAHLVRAAAYGAGWCLAVSLAVVAGLALVRGMASLEGAATHPGTVGVSTRWYSGLVTLIARADWIVIPTGLVSLALPLLWTPLYWWCFAKLYLRLPHATWVVFAMLVMTALAMSSLLLFAGVLY